MASFRACAISAALISATTLANPAAGQNNTVPPTDPNTIEQVFKLNDRWVDCVSGVGGDWSCRYLDATPEDINLPGDSVHGQFAQVPNDPPGGWGLVPAGSDAGSGFITPGNQDNGGAALSATTTAEQLKAVITGLDANEKKIGEMLDSSLKDQYALFSNIAFDEIPGFTGKAARIKYELDQATQDFDDGEYKEASEHLAKAAAEAPVVDFLNEILIGIPSDTAEFFINLNEEIKLMTAIYQVEVVKEQKQEELQSLQSSDQPGDAAIPEDLAAQLDDLRAKAAQADQDLQQAQAQLQAQQSLSSSQQIQGSPKDYICRTGPCTFEQWQAEAANLDEVGSQTLFPPLAPNGQGQQDAYCWRDTSGVVCDGYSNCEAKVTGVWCQVGRDWKRVAWKLQDQLKPGCHFQKTVLDHITCVDGSGTGACPPLCGGCHNFPITSWRLVCGDSSNPGQN